MRDGYRQQRVMAALSEAPNGLAAEVLIGKVCPPDKVQRQRFLHVISKLAADGRISISGKVHRTEISSALVCINR